MQEDRLSGVSTFIAVVDAGSFAAAALKSHVTRSAISKSIAKLETRLRVRLFHRSTRQQTLTAEGAKYYEQCSRLVADIRDTEAALQGNEQGVDGRLRISAPVLFGRRCVAPVLRALVKEHPRLEVAAEFSDRVVDLVSDGFDVAVRIGELADSTTLMSRKIGVQKMAIFASPSYLATNGIPRTLTDLAEHRGILYGRSLQATWRVRGTDNSPHEVRLAGRELYDDLQVVADSAIDGGGLAWLPYWLGAPYVATGRLQLVMDSDRVASVEIYAVWPQSKYLPYRTRLVIDSLVSQLSKTSA